MSSKRHEQTYPASLRGFIVLHEWCLFASTFTFVWGFTYKKKFRADALSQKISSRFTVLLVFVAVIQTELRGSIEPSKLVLLRFVFKDLEQSLCF